MVTPLPIRDGAVHEIFSRPFCFGTPTTTVRGAVGANNPDGTDGGGGVGLAVETFVFNIRFEVEDLVVKKVPAYEFSAF